MRSWNEGAKGRGRRREKENGQRSEKTEKSGGEREEGTRRGGGEEEEEEAEEEEDQEEEESEEEAEEGILSVAAVRGEETRLFPVGEGADCDLLQQELGPLLMPVSFSLSLSSLRVRMCVCLLTLPSFFSLALFMPLRLSSLARFVCLLLNDHWRLSLSLYCPGEPTERQTISEAA